MQTKAMALTTTAAAAPYTLLHPTASSRHPIPIKSSPISPQSIKSRPKTISCVKSSNPPPSTAAAATPPTKNWSLDSWKSKKVSQLPDYPDENSLESVLKTLESFPPIVFAGEARSLEEKLAQAALGNAFLLQGGDCAESFKEFTANNIRDTFRVLLQMSVVLMFGGQMPIIKVGRMAGQFAKPRSDSFEEKDGIKLPSYRGDNINGDAFDEKSRIPDPQRMIRAYTQSVATLNLLRAFATGGYAAMQRVTQWNLDFTEQSEQGDRYIYNRF
ncbi:hypothetical protein ACP275_14G102800 [Erythranthe tilingii]